MISLKALPQSESQLTLADVKEKTPCLEQFLLEIAKGQGAKKAVLFDGSVVNLVKSDDTPMDRVAGKGYGGSDCG